MSDLSAFAEDRITDDGATISVDLDGGESFAINHTNIENIISGADNDAPEAQDDAEIATTLGISRLSSQYLRLP